MDYREDAFRRKFKSAAESLGVKPEQIVSLKFRDNIGSYEEYRHLIDCLQREAGVQCTNLDGDLQGRGYLLGSDKSKVILVEHETGLEILYIAGSIASLIGLVPLILQGWDALRGRFWGRDVTMDQPVETRRIDHAGHVYEEHLHNRQFMGSVTSIGMFAPAFTTVASLIENETKTVTQQLELLVARVERLEEQLRHEQQPVVEKTGKPKTRLPRGPRAKISSGTKRP
jgi:hypothetical protein